MKRSPACSVPPAPQDVAGQAISRRKFMSFVTAGATALAVQGCGGGSAAAAPVTTSPATGGTSTPPATGGGTTPPATPAAPVWSNVPALVFTQGVQSSISVAQYVSSSSATGLVLSLNSVALPPGVTFNAAAMRFDYDGVGAAVTSDGHVLTANG